MDAKARDLVLFAAQSLFRAGIAWIMDQAVFGTVFFLRSVELGFSAQPRALA
jgi:hypothetical protein